MFVETEKEAAAQHGMQTERTVSVSGITPSSSPSPASTAIYLSVVPKTSMTRRFRRTVTAGGAVFLATDNDDKQNAAAESVTPVVGVPIVVPPVVQQQCTRTRRKFYRKY
jgi:hypothetical protein